MVRVWHARIDVYRHLVHQLGAGGVGYVSVSADNNTVKGKNEVCCRCCFVDVVGDDVEDVNGLSNEACCYVVPGITRMIGGVVPGSSESLCNIHRCSGDPRSVVRQVSGIDIACCALGTEGPLARRGVRKRVRIAITLEIVYRVVDKHGGGCKHWDKADTKQSSHKQCQDGDG